MSFKDLREFIRHLEDSSDLIRIKKEVSSFLEITEIHRRLIDRCGPAILFESVVNEFGQKSNIPVLVNLFGTTQRVAMGLGTHHSRLREVGELLAFLKSPTPPESLKAAFDMLPLFKTLMSMKPKYVKKGLCQELIFRESSDIDLTKFPIQTCWPHEPAPLITWPLVVTKGPSMHSCDNYNLGVYRMQVLGKNKAIMRWLKHRGGAQHYHRWISAKKEDLPAAVVIGADPGTILAAVTPIPDSISEYQFAGLLRNKSVELVDCITVPIKVPANAEIILEGYVRMEEYHEEGPYGDHTGYYNSVEKFPVFKISAITTRKDPIYLSTFTGRPPDEPSIIGEALNEVFIPLLISQFSEIVDFWLPPEGCSYRIAIVSINKTYPGQAKRIIMGIFSFLRQFLYTKFIIVVDKEINVRDWKDVMWAISTKMDPSRDITIIENAPIDYLDFASTENGLGSKIGLDATDKIYPETKREWGKKISMSQEIVDLVSANWEKYFDN